MLYPKKPEFGKTVTLPKHPVGTCVCTRTCVYKVSSLAVLFDLLVTSQKIFFDCQGFLQIFQTLSRPDSKHKVKNLCFRMREI